MKTYSTGEIAKFCDVNLRTVIRWIEKGELEGFKLPGRGNNRITEAAFLRFLSRHNIPMPDELKGTLSLGQGILIVDDEEPVANAIQRVLRGAGYKTHTAQDGFRAGSMLVQLKPELITLDLCMPGLDGFDVIRFVRDTPEISHVKIITISALDKAQLEESVQCGADAYLQKPFLNSDLLRLVEELITAPQAMLKIV
jgi:excisionase family DNA binding protein